MNGLVCRSQVKRKGKSLSIRDVLGLVSQLKEQKRCKVFLILNDDALEEEERADFRKYFEKTVDTTLTFEPSAIECAHIALEQGTKAGRMLFENCISLGIRNIRLIKRIERSVRRIEIMLKEFDDQVLKQAVQSLTLLGWSVYEPMTAPTTDYLQRRFSGLFGPKEKEEVSEKEASWNALLDAYGFLELDEFDLVLLEGTRNGYFDQSLIRKHAEELDKNAKAAQSGNSWKDAWRAYHDSFSNNEQQVLDTIYQSFLKDIQYRNVFDLNSAMTLLKGLGRPGQAAEIMKQYIDAHVENASVFDLEIYPFRDKIDDPDIVRAFNDEHAKLKAKRNPKNVLITMANQHGWSEEDMNVLSALSVDDYYAIFKEHEGDELRNILDTCLQFDRIGGASHQMKQISKLAKEALARIGKESRINARRVTKYGVKGDVV